MHKIINKNIFTTVLLKLVVFKILCAAQVLQFGTCPEVDTMEYFDVERFQGIWYEIQRFPTWYEDYGQCAYKTIDYCARKVEIEHGFIRDGIRFILHLNSTYSPGDEAVFHIAKNNIAERETNERTIHLMVNGYRRPCTPATPRELLPDVADTLSPLEIFRDPVGIPLSVISTDYNNYAILYGCKYNEELDIKYILAWILSRERTLESDLLRQAQLILNSIPSASVAYLQTVEQSEEKCSFHWTAHVQATYYNVTIDEDLY